MTPIAELARTAAYLLVGLFAPIIAIHVYWALGGRWGLQTAIGEGNPLPASPLSWAVAAALLAAGLTVLGRVGVWGASLPHWIFLLGPWVLVAVFIGGAVLNLTSGRPWDTFVFAPIFLLLAVLAAVVAWWAPR